MNQILVVMASLASILAIACETPAVQPAASWCFAEIAGTREGWRELTSGSSEPVDARLMNEAVRSLRRRSVRELTGAEASRYLGHRPSPSERYYLARGGIYAPAGASGSEIDRLARQAGYQLHYTPNTKELIIMSFQSPATVSQERNIALVLSLPVQVEQVFVACERMR
jgi:hypothetical protein